MFIIINSYNLRCWSIAGAKPLVVFHFNTLFVTLVVLAAVWWMKATFSKIQIKSTTATELKERPVISFLNHTHSVSKVAPVLELVWIRMENKIGKRCGTKRIPRGTHRKCIHRTTHTHEKSFFLPILFFGENHFKVIITVFKHCCELIFLLIWQRRSFWSVLFSFLFCRPLHPFTLSG